ncbi:MAG: tRNA (adenosine(37)-N6)-threonylcarbamoyltransferase complex transferase subunit TsaD [Candidatus Andersenbacteria bacterium]
MSEKTITLLAIESSCDDTGVAVVRKNGEKVTVLADFVNSQSIHRTTGGVIPEQAAREHTRVIGPIITDVMKRSGLTEHDIDAIAVTTCPGLMPSLAVGVQAAKALAYAWNKKIVSVHHIEGHIYSALLEIGGGNLFPALAVIISGGHTMLIRMKGHLQYEILGETRDDAIGEVFDKVARMLGLGYPGGPIISMLAEKGDKNAFAFPRPMKHSHDLDFSYSGLKTAVLYQVRDIGENITQQDKANIAASFQQAIIDSVIGKLALALDQDDYKTILFAGGVAANTALRNAMQQEADRRNIVLSIAPKELCGDNAVMIGQVGTFAYEADRIEAWKNIDASARKSIEEFSN